MVRILKPAEIEQEKYQPLLKRYAPNCPYFLPWYLEAATDGHWRLLVYNDYEVALPFPVARFGPFQHVPHRFYIQKLGFLGGSKPQQEEMLTMWQKRYPFGYYAFHLSPLANCAPIRQRKNCVLTLNTNYEQLKLRYSEQHLRKVKQRQNYVYERITSELEIHQVMLALAKEERHPLSAKNEQRRRLLMSAALHHKALYFQKATNSHEALAYNWWIFAGNRYTYLGGAENSAAHSLQLKSCGIDAFIQEFSGQDLLFDFEGSDIPGIARYYEGFGAAVEYYSAWEHFPSWYRYWQSFRK